MRPAIPIGLVVFLLAAGAAAPSVGEPLTPRTHVSLRGERWFINGEPTNRGSRAEGRLMNVRMVNAVFEDRHRPDRDPDAITDRFLAKLRDYAAHGVNAITLNLQGGMPGYEGALNSAFEPDGSLRESYLARAGRVIEACDRAGRVVILGCFYQRQDQVLADEAAVRAGVVNVAHWIRSRGFRNVVLEIANEFDHVGFDRRLIRGVAGEIELIRLAKKTAPELLVSTSGQGHGRCPDALAEAADFLLIHFNGTTLEDIPARIAALERFGKPIICNEDPKTGEAGARAAELCVAGGASWGFMAEALNQHFPFTFNGAGDDRVVYAKLKELTTPASRPDPEAREYYPPPESRGGWRKLDDPDAIRRLAGMDPEKLAGLRTWLRQSDRRNFAAVVIRRGYIVLEEERGNSAVTDSRRVASCSKAICATVLAIASERSRQGHTPRRMSFEDRAFDFIPWAHPLSDPRKAKITVKQLLNHTSGICPEAVGAPNDGTWEYILGQSGDARTERLAFDPGTACGYSTHALAHAALVCETVTGKPYDEFAIEALFKPLGIERWSFQYYEGGPKVGRHPSHGLGMPAREMARIAYCMARGGRWEGRQVIPEWFVEQTATPTHDVRGPELRFKVNAQVFSHGWELPARLTGEGGRSGRGIPPDARSKPGSGGQLIAFVPSLDLVVARQTGSSGGWEYEEFLRRACAAVVETPPERPASDAPNGEVTAGTVLGVRGTRFTLGGEPTFLLGMSYYGALGAPEEFVRRDLADLARHGFNWVRVWATWRAFGEDVSAVDAEGRPREPYLGRLEWLVAECDRRGLVVDVTLTRGDGANRGAIPDLQAHRRAVGTLVGALKGHRNWYLDLANERDVRDARHVPAEELKALREQVRKLDPERLVTASFGGHDLDEADLREALRTIGLDFVAPHRPRDAGSAGQTEARTRECLATMRRIGRPAPVHYQEPFRRGYGRWQPTASDFLTDLRGAVAGGAAGWCLHNGSSRGAPEERPRRSFDLHDRRLFDQRDEQEREVVARAAAEMHRAQPRKDLEFRHHFIALDLPSDHGQGDYGLTALADLDRDGDLDFVCGGRIPRPERLYWFEYRGPDDWVRHDVGADYRSDVGLAALDVDRDGWVDLVCSGVWYRNPGKPREAAFERIPFAEGAAGAHDILVADVDRDGRAEALMMGDSRTALNALCWFRIPADPRRPWLRHQIGPGIHGAITPAGAFDIDGDTDLDVARGDTWYENRDGKGLDWRPHKNLPMGRSGPYGVCVRSAVADLDGDGRPELVVADADIAESRVAVLWNRGGKGADWRKQELPQSFRYGSLHALAVADLNGDGRPDIVVNEQEELLPAGRHDPRWVAWENLGEGKFAERVLLDQRLGGHELQVGDVDGDGDIDIASKPWSASPRNGAGGNIHVDYLENRTRP